MTSSSSLDRTCDVIICIPTRDGYLLLKRILDYYADTGFKGAIFVGDSSVGESYQKSSELMDSYRGRLMVQVFHHPKQGAVQVLDKLCPFIETPYVTFCADDDFLCSSGLARCAEFLDEHHDYISASDGKVLSPRRGIKAHRRDGLLTTWLRLKRIPLIGALLTQLKHRFVDSKQEYSLYSLSRNQDFTKILRPLLMPFIRPI